MHRWQLAHELLPRLSNLVAGPALALSDLLQLALDDVVEYRLSGYWQYRVRPNIRLGALKKHLREHVVAEEARKRLSASDRPHGAVSYWDLKRLLKEHR